MIDMPDCTRSDTRLFADERGLFSTDQLNHAKIPPNCKRPTCICKEYGKKSYGKGGQQ